MSATFKHCMSLSLKLAERLPLPFGVERKPFVEAIAKCLAKHADDDDHATRIAAHAAETLAECPVPAILISIARELRGDPVEEWTVPEEWRRGDGPKCETCNDTGIESYERNGYWYARPCACRPTTKAPEPVVARNATTQRGMHQVDPRMLAAGGAE